MHDQIWKKWVAKNIFPPRLLLSGDAEKTLQIAIEIAAALQKVDPKKIENGQNLDTTIFADTGKSFKISIDGAKKDDQAEHENVRGACKWIFQKPVSAYRIMILAECSRISYAALPAFLKAIEEPPERAIFIFTTRNHHQIHETILSRMTVLRLARQDLQAPISARVREFLSGKDLISAFGIIENLEKTAKENPTKKINRQIFFDFLSECLRECRDFAPFRRHFEKTFETYLAISANQNPRFCLQRLAFGLQNF